MIIYKTGTLMLKIKYDKHCKSASVPFGHKNVMMIYDHCKQMPACVLLILIIVTRSPSNSLSRPLVTFVEGLMMYSAYCRYYFFRLGK